MSAQLEAEVLSLLRQYNDDLPRSRQSVLGWSSAGSDCSRQVWSILTDQPKVNEPNVKVLAGLRGRAVHELLGPVFAAAGWKVELPVEYAGIPGHADLYRDGVVADIKTGDAAKVRALRTYGPEQGWRVQIQGYARALTEQGYEVHTVRIIAIAYDSSEEVAVWQEPYDPAVTDLAVTRVRELAAVRDAPEPSKGADFCKDWCSFYDETGEHGCPSLAPGPNTPELDDPTLAQAAADFHAAKQAEKEAKQAKQAAAAVLANTYGQAAGLRVKTVTVADGEELDVAQLRDFYELAYGALPMRRKPGYSYVDVKPIAKRKAS